MTPDPDAETIEILKGTTVKATKDASGTHKHCIEITCASGVMHTLAAASAAELTTWSTAIESAAAGKPVGPTKDGSSLGQALSGELGGAPLGSIESGKMDVLVQGISQRMVSGRSEASPSTLGNATIPDTSLMTFSGWLTKKGEGLMAGSQKRWFVLFRNGEIHYFDKEWTTPEVLAQVVKAKGHKGVINLAGVKPGDVLRTKPSSTSDFTFHIITPKRKWVLIPASANQVDEWLKKIIGMLA